MTTAQHLNNFLEGERRTLESNNMINNEYLGLYSFIKDETIRLILASLHGNLVNLFDTMNKKLPTIDVVAHFYAEPSRSLIKIIDMTFEMQSNLIKSKFAFDIDEYYLEILTKSRKFLSPSGGSTLPLNMKKINLYYKIPIFTLSDSIITNITEQNTAYDRKILGEGSYAHVYKYKDTFYNRKFVVKTAKKELTDKEIERFKREFEEMKKLSSPYIVEVYNYDEVKKEYIMEFMDCTLLKYIEKNQDRLRKETRKAICSQILRAFKYIHSKDILHRDISPHNILIKHYENVDVAKISDFGLVKIPDSSLTSCYTEFKGSFNDPALVTEGFENYKIQHETYAITKIIYFVMTGKMNTSDIQDSALNQYVDRGLNVEKSKRFQNTSEMIDELQLL